MLTANMKVQKIASTGVQAVVKELIIDASISGGLGCIPTYESDTQPSGASAGETWHFVNDGYMYIFDGDKWDLLKFGQLVITADFYTRPLVELNHIQEGYDRVIFINSHIPCAIALDNSYNSNELSLHVLKDKFITLEIMGTANNTGELLVFQRYTTDWLMKDAPVDVNGYGHYSHFHGQNYVQLKRELEYKDDTETILMSDWTAAGGIITALMTSTGGAGRVRDGWGNDPEINSEGLAVRYTINESSYKYLSSPNVPPVNPIVGLPFMPSNGTCVYDSNTDSIYFLNLSYLYAYSMKTGAWTFYNYSVSSTGFSTGVAHGGLIYFFYVYDFNPEYVIILDPVNNTLNNINAGGGDMSYRGNCFIGDDGCIYVYGGQNGGKLRRFNTDTRTFTTLPNSPVYYTHYTFTTHFTVKYNNMFYVYIQDISDVWHAYNLSTQSVADNENGIKSILKVSDYPVSPREPSGALYYSCHKQVGDYIYKIPCWYSPVPLLVMNIYDKVWHQHRFAQNISSINANWSSQLQGNSMFVYFDGYVNRLVLPELYANNTLYGVIL